MARSALAALGILAIAAAQSASWAANETPAPIKPPCAANSEFAAIDISIPTQNLRTAKQEAALAAFEEFGVKTVLRYYDHEEETLAGKTLLPAESDAILAAGLSIGVVFQHFNDDPGKFLDRNAGTKDAERALVLADQNRQPYGSAIYFGIDGPELNFGKFLIPEYKLHGGKPMPASRKAELKRQGMRGRQNIESYQNFITLGPELLGIKDLRHVRSEMMKPVIEKYFQQIHKVFARYAQEHANSGYKVGLYCTAAMCNFLQDRKLVDYIWLSPQGRNGAEYKEYLRDQRTWNLIQQLPTTCDGWTPKRDGKWPEIDFDRVNAAQPDFGQWGTKRPAS